jgi:hypothetical protein
LAANVHEFYKAARALSNDWLSRFKNDKEMLEIIGTFINEYVNDADNRIIKQTIESSSN